MKRLLFAAAVLAAPFFFFSCEKPDDNGGGKEPGTGTETEAPVLNNTTEGDISVPCEGGSFSLTYTIENQVTGGQLSAKSENEWISNINYNVLGTVSFDVAANEAFEPRDGEITVEYQWPDSLLSFSVKVAQDAAPIPPYDIELAAEDFNGIYYADRMTPGSLLYFFTLSDVGFGSTGYANPNGHFVRIALLTDVAPDDMDNIVIPEGTYPLSALESYNSYYLETDASGQTSTQNAYTEFTMTVTRDGGNTVIDVDAVLDDGKTLHCTYSGEGVLDDQSVEILSTLTGDYEADFSDMAPVAAYYYGDFYGTGTGNWMIVSNGIGDGIQLDLCSSSADFSSGFAGSYTVDDSANGGTAMYGYIENNYLTGSWYVLSGIYGLEGYAPCIEGEIVITDNGNGTYTISLDCMDDNVPAYNFTGSWTGEISIVDESQYAASVTAPEAERVTAFYKSSDRDNSPKWFFQR